jgi:hypothetical protein
MTAPRTMSTIWIGLAIVASLAVAPGCGSNPPEVDTAETIRTDTAKPAPSPATPTNPTPSPTPAKEAPKG